MRISSTIKPIYGFTGTILEYALIHTERAKGLDGAARRARYVGDGADAHAYIAAADLAAYAVEAVSEPGAAAGGFYRVRGFRASLLELAATYERVRGVALERERLGSARDVDDMLARARACVPPHRHAEYVGLAYAKYMLDGRWDGDDAPDCARWPGVRQTSFEQWLRDHPEV